MRIGVWQTEGLTGDPAGNIARLAARLEAATADRPDLLVCPELWLTGYNDPEAIRAHAEPADGAGFRALSDLARRTGVAIAYGYAEQDPGDPRIYNSAQLIGGDGAPVLGYRKLQLWGSYERALFAPGAARTLPALHAGWKIGFSICYDTEFPETTRYLARQGAELVLAPTALATGSPQVPDLIVPTRALESHLFIAFANRCGEERGLVYHGGSCVVGPDGAKRAQAGAEDAWIVADIERGQITVAAAQTPYLQDLRQDL